MAQLYEQKREGRINLSALGMYVRRWNAWLKGGLGLASSFRFILPPPLHEAETTKARECTEEER